jgi:prefoldin subunit 5
MMEETIRGRLEALKADYVTAERELVALDQRSAELRQLLLRMSGAIQVLEELAAAGNGLPLAEATA